MGEAPDVVSGAVSERRKRVARPKAPMYCKLLKNQARRIAKSILPLAATAGLAIAAETPDIRISAPSLGWVSTSDASQGIEIVGVTESPRTGRSIVLPAAVRRLWASPDSGVLLVQTSSSLTLLRTTGQADPLFEVTPTSSLSVAWDRSSDGFAACWETSCEARDANGAIRSRWDVPAGARAMAYSATAGLLIATADSAEWRTTAESVRLDAIPAAAVFRPGTNELWVLDAEGHLTGRDIQGRNTGSAELIAGAIGLVASLDGKAFFAATAEGAAAVANLETQQTEQLTLEDTVEGVWPASGRFNIRLHDSAKRAIGIWNGDTKTTGWVPALNTEVRQ